MNIYRRQIKGLVDDILNVDNKETCLEAAHLFTAELWNDIVENNLNEKPASIVARIANISCSYCLIAIKSDGHCTDLLGSMCPLATGNGLAGEPCQLYWEWVSLSTEGHVEQARAIAIQIADIACEQE